MPEAIRENRIVRSSGARIQVVDTHHPDSPVGPDEPAGTWDGKTPRFATFCDTHGNYVLHDSWTVAREFVAVPEEWCADCRRVVEERGRGGPPDGETFTEEERQRAQEARSAAAAERRREREELEERERAERAAAVDADEAWSQFVVGAPNLPAKLTSAERAERDQAVAQRLTYATVAAEARRRIRAAEAELDPADAKVPPPKRKRAKELERAISEWEGKLQEVEANTAAALERKHRACRTGYLRAVREAGWEVRRNGVGWFLEKKGAEPVRLPPDYLPEEAMKVG